MNKALIIVDVQKDFCKDGSLEVEKAGEIIPIINFMMQDKKYDVVVATQDWHPKEHCSFKSSGGQWPEHCVMNQRGSELHDGLNKDMIRFLIKKGMNSGVDSYSGFFDNGYKRGTSLESILRKLVIEEVHIVGLATDYCVKYTAIDAMVLLGYKVEVHIAACRGINNESIKYAITQMRDLGIRIV